MKRHIRCVASCGATISGSLVTFQKQDGTGATGQVPRELASRWPKNLPAEEMSDLSIDTKTGRHRFLEEKFDILDVP